MAEEIPLEVLEGQCVIRKWIDSLPRLGYVHAFQIPTDREDLLDAVKKGWNVRCARIEEGHEMKDVFDDFVLSLAIGEIIPVLRSTYKVGRFVEEKPSHIPGLNIIRRELLVGCFSTFTYIIPKWNDLER